MFRIMQYRCISAFLLAMCACIASAEDSLWQAGLAARKITPDVGLWMAGYSDRDRPADGTLTDLWAKAICLQDNTGQRFVLVTLDLIGIDRELSQSICRQLANHFGLTRQQIVLCVSHTHTGPVVGKNLNSMHYRLLDAVQQQRIAKFAERLEQTIIEVVGAAIGELAPSQLTWGNGRATFAVNRRNNREADVPTLRAQNKLSGPQDHDVPVLAVRSPAGDLRGIVFGYACHATVLNFFQWSGDYAGFAQQALEQDYPGCVAMFWAGCGADQNPLPRRYVELAQRYGHELAGSVKQVLDETMESIRPNLRTSYDEIELRFDRLPTAEELATQAQDTNRYVAARARMLQEQIAQGQPLLPAYPYPVSTCRLGEQVQWIFLGGEVVVDYALRLKANATGPATWVTAYAHDVMAYIPSRRVLLEGGYEGGGAMVYYGLPTVWSLDVEHQIVEQVAALHSK